MSTEALWDEAIGHLRTLLQAGWCVSNSDLCHYCGADLGAPSVRTHRRDCPWMIARAFLRKVGENPAPAPKL